MNGLNEIPAKIRRALEALDKTIIVKCRRRGCSQVIHVHFDHLSDSGFYDLDCPLGHCHLYDQPRVKQRLDAFYARQFALHNPPDDDDNDDDDDDD